MRFVLDSCVAIKWVLPEADSQKALSLRDDYQNGTHELIAPDIFKVEVAHALTRAERRTILQVGEAVKRMLLVVQARPHLHSFDPLLPRALEISSQERIGVYDCLYVALGEREQCMVVSADQRLVNAFPSNVIPLFSV
jgi:predicted nucleic acid-binding protein